MENTPMPAELAEIIKLHREMFTGWTMQADAADTTDDTAAADSTNDDSEGTDDTDADDQSDDKTDWKRHSRRHEDAAKAAKKERDTLQKQLDAITKALNPNGDKSAADPAAELQKVQTELAQMRLHEAVRKAAAKTADADKLLDSVAFLNSIATIDPGDADRLTAAVKKAVTDNPAYAPAGPRTGGDLAAGHGRKPENTGTGVNRLAAAFEAKYDG